MVCHGRAQLSESRSLKIVFIGPPGSGKSTQASFVCEAFGIPQVSTGDMLRAAMRDRTPIGLQVEKDMHAGNLISDEIVIGLAKHRLCEADCANGFLLDGFPRTLNQAQVMHSSGIAVDYVIEFDVPDSEIVGRMGGRRVHPPSGRSYHILHNPPREGGFDDVTGEPLVLRDDDRVAVVLHRLSLYYAESSPVGKFYADWYCSEEGSPTYLKVNGMGAISDIRAMIFSALRQPV